MAKTANQKLKLLYLADIFRRQTDEDHALSIKEISERLAALDIASERKALYTDIEALRFFGMDIVKTGEASKTKYFLADDGLDLSELRLLADAVACSKFVTEKGSKKIIKKLEALTSEYCARELDRSVIVANRAKSVNEQIFYNINSLREAIDRKCKISFSYFHWDVNKKKKYPLDENGERAVYEGFSPYSLAWSNECYYAIGYYEKYNKISNFRIDRMENIKVLDVAQIKDDSFRIAEYSKRVFSMFSGSRVRATLLFDNGLTDSVIDRFGSGVRMIKYDDDHFTVTADIDSSPTFFAWMTNFGGRATILSPDELRTDMREHLEKILKGLS